MCRNGPVSSSRTGSTPSSLVYQPSLAARSDTVSATWAMAGMVVGVATVVLRSMDVREVCTGPWPHPGRCDYGRKTPLVHHHGPFGRDPLVAWQEPNAAADRFGA